MTQRRCLSCGCAHRSLQRAIEHRPSWCPSCGADLYARPPMSYAEMEGISVLALPIRRPLGIGGMLERSIAIGLGIVVTLGLFANALR